VNAFLSVDLHNEKLSPAASSARTELQQKLQRLCQENPRLLLSVDITSAEQLQRPLSSPHSYIVMQAGGMRAAPQNVPLEEPSNADDSNNDVNTFLSTDLHNEKLSPAALAVQTQLEEMLQRPRKENPRVLLSVDIPSAEQGRKLPRPLPSPEPYVDMQVGGVRAAPQNVPLEEPSNADDSNYEEEVTSDYENWYQAIWDFHAEQPHELSFKRGDLLKVVSKEYDEHSWWVAKLPGNNGSVGFVPKTHLMVAYVKVQWYFH
ncbi:hypothetical protein MTO96_046049, partial [Rhipicephalus appendiculatus]